MSLKDKLKDVTVSEMKKCQTVFVWNLAPLRDYFNDNNDSIKLLFDNNIITNEHIDPILEEKVLYEVRTYIIRMDMGIWRADHVYRRDFLAYALDNNVLSPKEIHQIVFDDGQTIPSFILRYGKKDFIHALRNELLNPDRGQNYIE
jgi:hypothetical protein